MNVQRVTPASSGSANAKMTRRSLLRAGAAALGTSRLSYGRIIGANERILLVHVGMGNRGRELASIAGRLKARHNVELAAVCDLWKVNSERAQAAARQEDGRPPSAFVYIEGLLAMGEGGAVLVSTADFQH